MLGNLHEVRPGRTLYVETFFGSFNGQFAKCNIVALAVHGAMCHHSQYDPQTQALVDSGVAVVRYDLLGCGDSQKPRPKHRKGRLNVYSPEAAYLDLLAVFDQFTKDFDSVLLLGHSYGGPLVVRLAAEHPKRIAGLVTLGIGYPSSSQADSRPHSQQAQAGRGPWFLRIPEWLLQILLPVVAAQLIRSVYHPVTFQNNPKLIRAEWLAWSRNAPWVVQALLPQIAQLVTPFSDFRAKVQSVQAPGLIVDQESSAPAGQTPPERMAADMQDAEGFAIPLSKHQVHQDQPEAVNALLVSFLQKKVCHVQAHDKLA